MVITSPAANDQWVSTVQHTIQWNRASGAPNGTISLVNAATGAVAGWIQQQILPTQTSFPWNTRDIFTTKTGPLKEDVAPGQYRIVLTFNSPSDPPVTGPEFSIITAAEAQIPASTIVIQGAVFSPSSLTVLHGTQLTFVNHDTTSYQLLNSSNANVFVVAPSASKVFDTSSFASGSYVFYSTSSPSLRVTVTVK
jgi:plastocyanin